MKHDVILIGVGNEFRGDDALGAAIAREFDSRSIHGLKVMTESGEGASLMEAWSGAYHVIIVDAISSGQTPGTVHRFDASTTKIPRRTFHYSSHAFGVAEAIEMARELQLLPSTLIVYGIEGNDFTMGRGITPSVQSSMAELIKRIEQDVLQMSS